VVVAVLGKLVALLLTVAVEQPSQAMAVTVLHHLLLEHPQPVVAVVAVHLLTVLLIKSME
jgi:hypothetical protein